MNDDHWDAVTDRKLAAYVLAVLLFFVLLVTDGDGFVFLVDGANLLFHEAGHIVFGFFGDTIGLYGGTLGQLVFPIVVTVSFWRKGQPFSFAGGLVWFFENLLNIACYMADARAQQLPLVGGGDHDWTNIFTRWGVLAQDTQIAGAVRWMGWLGMIAASAWVVWRWRQDRAAARSSNG
ncbi:MAG TPA: hypothetical protein VJW76_01145 [Verrucomicrobiae bacterium]|nr:hypothetical protein [Verrucomicrobiae bacterium]